MLVKLTNNAKGTLASPITTGATSLTLAAGQGALFPALAATEWFPATLIDQNDPSLQEIVRVTARSTDTLTISRQQEGTAARAFTAGALVELRPTAAIFSEIKADFDGLSNTYMAKTNPTDSNGNVVWTQGNLTFSLSGTTLTISTS